MIMYLYLFPNSNITNNRIAILRLFTFKHIWNAALEINQCRIVVDTVLFGHRKILGLDKRDAMSITIIVDVLQLFENFSAMFTIVGIYGQGNSKIYKNQIYRLAASLSNQPGLLL